MQKLFGTDGIRGTANQGVMTAETAMKVGMAAGSVFTNGDHRHRVIIGKDTRLSGYLLEPALTAGFISVGMDVILVGPMPTPAIAMLTRSMRADLGVMISASHNPYQDNGIKLFGPDGFKLSDKIEKEIELIIASNYHDKLVASEKLGRAKRLDDAQGRYIEFVKNTFPKNKSLSNLKIAIDCANGAAYHIGPIILWELGAEVIPIGVNPDGFNINQACGSTYPSYLAEEVVKNKADIGIALDGDADRLIIVDEKGQIIDGDQIIALITQSWKEKNLLKTNYVVTTIMSNMGFEQFLNNNDINLIRTQVGDRYVTEAMRKNKCNIGGEQSGHIILSDYSTTGDGLIAALQVLSAIVDQAKPVSDVCKVFTPLPQKLKNLKYKSAKNPLNEDTVKSAIKNAENIISGKGRILVRPSGTEPLIRIMVEAENEALLDKIISDLEHEISPFL